MKVRVDKPGRDQAAFGVDLFVNLLMLVLTDELDAIAVVNDGAVFDYFMFIAIEADDVAALDLCFHCSRLSGF